MATPRCALARCGGGSLPWNLWAGGGGKTPGAAAQIKSAVLLAGLAAPGITTVIETEASRDHTELMLKHFGADITSMPEGRHRRRIAPTAQPELRGAPVGVPPDPSPA